MLTCCSLSGIRISSAAILLFGHSATFSQDFTRKSTVSTFHSSISTLSTFHSSMFPFIQFVIIIFLSPVIINWVSSSVYEELRDLDVSCYPRDSCQCSPNPFDVSRTCECDPTCYRRATCCIDSPYVDFRQSTRNEVCSRDSVSVLSFGFSLFFYFQGGGAQYFQIGSCERGWSGSTLIKQMCEMENNVHGADLMVSIPVTNAYSGTTYKNYYCALCNNDAEGSVLWDFTISVNNGTMYSNVNDKFTIQTVDETHYTSEDIREGLSPCSDASTGPLVFNKEERSYGYWDYCSTDSPSFVKASVVLAIPDQIQHLVKSCRPDIISSCPQDWTDVRVKTLCESYLGIIKGPPKIVGRDGIRKIKYFRNAHCALCNNVTNFEGYSCDPFFTRPVLTPAYPVSYTVIFGHPLSDSPCLKNSEKYFEELGGCRPVICRQKVKNGKCTS